MKAQIYHVLGVMSGTSLDGIDLAHLKLIYENAKWNYAIVDTETCPYPSKWQHTLAEADQYTTEELTLLNKTYTHYLAQIIQAFIKQHALHNLNAICSHGHTILHQPQNHYTLQIGNLPLLAQLLKHTVICDFRVQDVALGGQGAPLVPIGDALLFSDYEACINLGGFANISLKQNNARIAYDICAVNTVLNRYAQKCGKEYDAEGKLAAIGKIDTALLKQLNQLGYYTQKPPKSLGIEWVKAVVLPLLEKTNSAPQTILATYTLHIAKKIAEALRTCTKGKALLTGGGAYNQFLVDCIQKQTRCKIVVPNRNLVDYKEALIFGLLGVLRMRNEINVLHQVTGASKDHCAGFIYQPTSF